jgi:hypothetical protein
MHDLKNKFREIKYSQLQISGIFLLIFLAVFMLWFININSSQATSAIAAKVRFYGE